MLSKGKDFEYVAAMSSYEMARKIPKGSNLVKLFSLYPYEEVELLADAGFTHPAIVELKRTNDITIENVTQVLQNHLSRVSAVLEQAIRDSADEKTAAHFRKLKELKKILFLKIKDILYVHQHIE